jgi:hypothetical protein
MNSLITYLTGAVKAEQKNFDDELNKSNQIESDSLK